MTLLVFLCLFPASAVLVRASKDCYVALSECNDDARCASKLTRYAKECGTIVDITNSIENTVRFPCSERCVDSINSLKRTKRGKVLWRCDCSLDAECLALKSRTEKCLTIANRTYQNRTSCTAALGKCMMENKCKRAQTDFLLKCYNMFTLTACTKECLRSQRKLFGLPTGEPLMDCECDGMNELYCLGLRAYADHMKCNWKTRWMRRRRRRRKNKQQKGTALTGKRKQRDGS